MTYGKSGSVLFAILAMGNPCNACDPLSPLIVPIPKHLDKTMWLLIIYFKEIEFYLYATKYETPSIQSIKIRIQNIKLSTHCFVRWVRELCYVITVYRLTSTNYNTTTTTTTTTKTKPHIEVITPTPSFLILSNTDERIWLPCWHCHHISISISYNTQAQRDIETKRISFFILNLVAWLCFSSYFGSRSSQILWSANIICFLPQNATIHFLIMEFSLPKALY